jgi:hypothetical protein
MFAGVSARARQEFLTYPATISELFCGLCGFLVRRFTHYGKKFFEKTFLARNHRKPGKVVGRWLRLMATPERGTFAQ